MDKSWYKSLTVWGTVLLFIGAGLEGIGVVGALDIISKLAIILGIPMTGIGIRRAIK